MNRYTTQPAEIKWCKIPDCDKPAHLQKAELCRKHLTDLAYDDHDAFMDAWVNLKAKIYE